MKERAVRPRFCRGGERGRSMCRLRMRWTKHGTKLSSYVAELFPVTKLLLTLRRWVLSVAASPP